ncbi:hypothetical protein ACFL20_08725, partial [Spirochaetota bacterium]
NNYTFKSPGISNEWKFKITDPVANTIGFALYAELGIKPHELEFEAKVILDKRFGNFLWAFNTVGEYELKFKKSSTDNKTDIEHEYKWENVMGFTYLPTKNFSMGVEIRNQNVIEENVLESSAFFIGPAISYSTKTWWVALTVLAQTVDFKKGSRDLEGHEKVEARLLFAFHL